MPLPLSRPHAVLSPRRWRSLALAACLCVSGAAQAAHHGLILWIGDYGNPRSNLPGIDLDAAHARKIALAMGVPEANIRELSNAQLTQSAVASALTSLTDRIAPGDKVFIYYSGHGGQVQGRVSGSRCTEGLVTRDPTLFEDFRLEQSLEKLGNKAAQVVVMNDSCFSGGAATKSIGALPSGMVAKFFPESEKLGGTTVSASHQCGNAVNKMGRALVLATQAKSATRVLHIAAASAEEVAGATSEGSVATLAWAACLRTADTDQSGTVSGEELRVCAQQHINKSGGRQTVTLTGNTQLPLSFTSAPAAAPATATNTTTAAPATATTAEAAPVRPLATMEDIRAGADSSVKVKLSSSNASPRIGKDLLTLTVTTDRPGYLYLLHAGSDGKTFDLLFPNKIDENNQVGAGTHELPRPSWRVRAAGPAGTSHVLALLSPIPLNLSKGMDTASVFPNAPATASTARNLVAEASESQGGRTGYGTSSVLAFREQP